MSSKCKGRCRKFALQDEPIGQWVVKRNIDGKDKPDFVFDQNFVVKAGAKIKVNVMTMRSLYCLIASIHTHSQ